MLIHFCLNIRAIKVRRKYKLCDAILVQPRICNGYRSEHLAVLEYRHDHVVDIPWLYIAVKPFFCASAISVCGWGA